MSMVKKKTLVSSATEEERGASHKHSCLVPCLAAKTKNIDEHQ